jgi:arylsulfatase A-like enzyme
LEQVDLSDPSIPPGEAHPTAVMPAGTKTDGVSLLPYIENRSHPGPRARIYAEQFPTSYNVNWERAIRDGRYKLIKRANGTREFYDLSADAFESRNLLQQTLTSTQRQTLGTLEQRLSALLATR